VEMVRGAGSRGAFRVVSIDAGYGKEPAFLRALDDDENRRSANPPEFLNYGEGVGKQSPKCARRSQVGGPTTPRSPPSLLFLQSLYFVVMFLFKCLYYIPSRLLRLEFRQSVSVSHVGG
jgi:hypothetical protein